MSEPQLHCINLCVVSLRQGTNLSSLCWCQLQLGSSNGWIGAEPSFLLSHPGMLPVDTRRLLPIRTTAQ